MQISRKDAFEELKKRIRYEDTQKTVEGSSVPGKLIVDVRTDDFPGYRKYFEVQGRSDQVGQLTYPESWELAKEYSERTGRRMGLLSARRAQHEASKDHRSDGHITKTMCVGLFSTYLSEILIKQYKSSGDGHDGITATIVPRPAGIEKDGNDFAYLGPRVWVNIEKKKGLFNSLRERGILSPVDENKVGGHFDPKFVRGRAALTFEFSRDPAYGPPKLIISSTSPLIRSKWRALVLAEIDDEFEIKINESGEADPFLKKSKTFNQKQIGEF